MACVIGLDVGTTSTIGILIRLPDQVLALASRPVTLHTPKPGWAEEDPRPSINKSVGHEMKFSDI